MLDPIIKQPMVLSCVHAKPLSLRANKLVREGEVICFVDCICVSPLVLRAVQPKAT